VYFGLCRRGVYGKSRRMLSLPEHTVGWQLTRGCLQWPKWVLNCNFHLQVQYWEWSRTICAHSVLAWWRQGCTLGTDQRGNHLLRWLCLLGMLQKEREIERALHPLAHANAAISEIAMRIWLRVW